MDRLQRMVGLTTYAGSALIVVSLMFLARDIQSSSFFVHAGAAIAMPGIFLALGSFMRRRTDGSLALDGLWTAGAWLLGVAILHLDAHRSLITDSWLQQYYWLIASAITAVAATIIGVRMRLVLIVPIVLILQGAFAWEALSLVFQDVFWSWKPVLMTGLAAAWIFIPFRDSFWRRAYRMGGGELLIILCGFVLLVKLDNPAAIVMTWLSASVLFIALGVRQHLAVVLHVGVWVFAGAWALIYHYWIVDPAVFGLWMTFPAGLALLFARLTRSSRKREKPEGIFAAMTRWTAADLAIGLSIISLVFTAIHLPVMSADMLTKTLLVLAALWLGLGIEYRVAIFVHLALYVAPIPLSFLIISSNIAFIHFPTLGIVWQIGGVLLLLIGHALFHQRIAIRVPFFLTGYVLVAVGNLLADSLTLPLSLGITTLTTLLTAEAVLIGWHPVWDFFVRWIAPSEKRPYAHRWLNGAFLLMGAWFAAIWFQLMLGATGLPAARQGLGLVLISSVWFLIGWTLDRVPGAVGWYVHSAGWLLWAIGLLQVFFSPTEAIITAIFGLVVSVEEHFRQRRSYWLPVVIMQVAFVTLQSARLLSLPPDVLLSVLGIGLLLFSLFSPQKHQRQSRWIAMCGSVILFWAWSLGLKTLNLAALVIPIVLITFGFFSLLIDRRNIWIGAVLALWGGWLLILPVLGLSGLSWQTLPIGILLIALSHLDYPESATIEMLGIGTILAGSALSFRQIGLESMPMSGTTVLLVVIYGVIAGRRRSFIAGTAAVFAGTLYLTVKLNPWLVPLFGGGLLIGISLLVETRREFAEQQLQQLTTIWRSWR